MRIIDALVAGVVGGMLIACTSSNPNASSSNRPDAGVASPTDATVDVLGRSVDSATEGADGGPPGSGVSALGQCPWPASLNDAGPGACTVGRAFVECSYPSGVVCDGGLGASGGSGITMLCISDDPTSCSGCASTAGAATCKNRCAANEYAVSCGGPPIPSPDGSFSDDYQAPPHGCVGAGVTPGGSAFSCCPCGGSASEAGAGSTDAGSTTQESGVPVPDAFVNAFVGPSNSNVSVCGLASELSAVSLGVADNPRPQTVANGDQNGAVVIDCKVDPNGQSFNVQLSAVLNGPGGGAISITGSVNPSTGQSIISGIFTTSSSGTFGESDTCTITFTYKGGPVPVAGSPIAEGRIWGHLSCPSAVQPGTYHYCDEPRVGGPLS